MFVNAIRLGYKVRLCIKMTAMNGSTINRMLRISITFFVLALKWE